MSHISEFYFRLDSDQIFRTNFNKNKPLYLLLLEERTLKLSH